MADYTVQLHFTAQRFRCVNPTCARHTFVESLGSLALNHAQWTQRFTSTAAVVVHYGHAEQVMRARHTVRQQAYATHPEHIVQGLPALPSLPPKDGSTDHSPC